MVAPPYLVSYAITKKCNLKCKHCYSEAAEESAPDELTTDEAKRLLDHIANWGAKLLIIDGGEPLCRDDFYQLARHASAKGLRVVVGSNGTLIDGSVATKMREAGVQAVAISVDGAQAETHDGFRGEEGAYAKAIEGIRACKDAGLPFQLNTVIRRRTITELPQILQLAVESGANAAEFFDLVQVSRVKRECAEEVLSVGEREKVMEWLAEAQAECPIIIRVPACPMYPLILKEKKIQPRHFPNNLLHRIPYYNRGCAAGMPEGYVTILPNGDVIPCMLLQVKIGNVRKGNIVDIWERSPILTMLRSRDLLKGECGECANRDICAGCRGRAYECTGNMLASDPGCWLQYSKN
ncbi:MAG: radical SAM protein [Candidatus Bathyarchaeia archaeon]